MDEARGFMPAGWTRVPAWAAPVEVAATVAPRQVSGFPVGVTAFASPSAGWALVGAPAVCRLLYTDDAGQTWRTQLAWDGSIGRLTALDARRAGLVLGLGPRADRVNGYPVGDGDAATLIATTGDGGVTWTVGWPPNPKEFTGHRHFLNPRQSWLLATPLGRYPQSQVARTEDGGASWATIDGPAHFPATAVAFTTPEDGLLVAVDEWRDDLLYVTGNGGDTWRPVRPAPPSGLPRNAVTWLTPLARPGGPVLLVLRTETRRPRSPQPRWVGTYAYIGTGGDAFAGPYRLPSTEDLPVILALGPTGRFWVASGHDTWVADTLAGPWYHRRVPLPAVQLLTPPWDPRMVPMPTRTIIADIAVVGDGVVWLTTSHGSDALGRVPTGQLYRSEDDGANWARLTVESR